MYEHMQKYTFRDLMEALKFIQRVNRFSENVMTLIRSLNRVGIDVNRLDPSNFGDILRLSMQLRSEGFIEDIDIEQIEKDFEDLMNHSIEDIQKYTNIIDRFLSYVTRSSRVIERYNRILGGSAKELGMLANMFGLKLPTGKDTTDDITITDTEELTEEEKKKLREIIEQFKSK